jgi:hypothetical protein
MGTAWTGTYDAAGDLTCRAPSSATTCAGGTPTGAQLGYDSEGRLASWQNAPTNPVTTDSFLYDGTGQRVAQQVSVNGTATTTTSIGGVEEVSSTGTTTTTTTSYSAAGKRIARR